MLIAHWICWRCTTKRSGGRPWPLVARRLAEPAPAHVLVRLMTCASSTVSRPLLPGLASFFPQSRPPNNMKRMRETRIIERAALWILGVFTLIAVAGYASFGRHPELISRFPGAVQFYPLSFAFFAQGHIIIAAGERS